ncbi:MAG: asparaginase [Bdellovibrionaceae bacterium]|nr:asparaginase [Bdellovibrionales bacterium]MCB9085593.1 asparaginase [Pseudobdellovibrionaceae bacterium]
MEKKRIHILTTGGTIEKSYCEYEGDLKNRESLLERKLLQKLRLPYTEVKLTSLMAKDSLYMTDEDREMIWQSVQGLFKGGDPILILHGTDTMENTIQYLYSKDPKPPIAVVFTGAMKPVGFDDTDAHQNFIEAFVLAQYVQPGYYISFHNHLFPAPKVRKNRDTGTFESTF